MVWFHLSLTEGFDGRTIRTVGSTRVLVLVPRHVQVALVGKYRLVGEVINKFTHREYIVEMEGSPSIAAGDEDMPSFHGLFTPVLVSVSNFP